MKRLIGASFVLMAITGCERDIDISPIAASPKLVVDAEIDVGAAAALAGFARVPGSHVPG